MNIDSVSASVLAVIGEAFVARGFDLPPWVADALRVVADADDSLMPRSVRASAAYVLREAEQQECMAA